MEMTNEQKTRDLAVKFRGGAMSNFACSESGPQCSPCLGHCGRGCAATNWPFAPFNSRDDAHELLGKLTDKQSDDVIEQMKILAPPNTNAVSWYLLTATPAHISEAVWRATCQ